MDLRSAEDLATAVGSERVQCDFSAAGNSGILGQSITLAGFHPSAEVLAANAGRCGKASIQCTAIQRTYLLQVCLHLRDELLMTAIVQARCFIYWVHMCVGLRDEGANTECKV